MNRHAVVGIGEVLWDLFPAGPRFGGAPANFACHAASLGAEALVVGGIGDDVLGREAVAALRDRGVSPRFVAKTPDRPTGSVAVSVGPSGTPCFAIARDVAWDDLPWSDGLEALAVRTDAVCFGTLGQRSPQSREAIRRFVATAPPACLRIFDVNLRPPDFDHAVIRDSLALATILKLSDEELPVVAEAAGLSGTEAGVISAFASRFELRAVAVTRGSRGATLLHDGTFHDCPAGEVTVEDTVGAGDAFTAALAMGLLRRHDIDPLLRRAVDVATFVCTRAGATPPLPAELQEPFLR